MGWSNEATAMAEDAPNTEVWAKFASEKWDHERARNALLHFVKLYNLGDDCAMWLEETFPEERYDEE